MLASVVVEDLVLGVAHADWLFVVLDVPEGARLELVDDALEDAVVAFEALGEGVHLFDEGEVVLFGRGWGLLDTNFFKR